MSMCHEIYMQLFALMVVTVLVVSAKFQESARKFSSNILLLHGWSWTHGSATGASQDGMGPTVASVYPLLQDAVSYTMQ